MQLREQKGDNVQHLEELIAADSTLDVQAWDSTYTLIHSGNFHHYLKFAESERMKVCLATILLNREIQHPYKVETSVRLALNAKADVNNQEIFPMQYAAKRGMLWLCKILHEYKTDLESGYGSTPLHQAAKEGHNDVVKWLLEQKIDINTRDQNGKTALHLSDSQVCKDNIASIFRKSTSEVTETLLANQPDKINVDAIDFYNETPLFDAVRDKNHDKALHLIKAGADLRKLNKYGVSLLDIADYHDEIWRKHLFIPALLQAIQNNDFNFVEKVCNAHRIIIAEINDDRFLSYAVSMNNEKMVKLLINNGAKVTPAHLDLADSADVYHVLFIALLKDRLFAFREKEEKIANTQHWFWKSHNKNLEVIMTMIRNLISIDLKMESLKQFEKLINKNPELSRLYSDYQLVESKTTAKKRAAMIADEIKKVSAPIHQLPLLRLMADYCINISVEEKNEEKALPGVRP